jgi:CHAT domain-containing protein
MVVGDPAPLPDQFKPLRYARFEAAVVSALTPDSFAPLIGEKATADAVLEQWAHAERAHLACHGVFDVRSPLQSALILAGGKFTLGETMTELSSGRGPREVVLSACQTALTEFVQLPEEVIGFPVGLIQAGAETVIGTLWSVNDWSTSLLMAKYAAERLSCSSAEALRRAQVWLRDSGPEELARFCREVCRMVSRTDAEAMRLHLAALTLRPRDAPTLFSEPYYWAGFTCWGIG